MEIHKDNLVDVDFETMQQLVEVLKITRKKYYLITRVL